jgi:uncharacterized membrane protein
MSRTTKIALSLGAAAVALGAGLGVAGMAAATTTPSPSPTPSSSAPGDTFADGHGMRGGRHGHGGAQLGNRARELAAKLGVDEAKVADALKTFRDANRPSAPPATPPVPGQKPDRAAREKALAASLAKSLGLDEAKVTAALEELRTAKHANHAAALKPRLDQAVKDGTLTQTEADAVTKAAEKGVIGGR